jgi:hypothetical protein
MAMAIRRRVSVYDCHYDGVLGRDNGQQRPRRGGSANGGLQSIAAGTGAAEPTARDSRGDGRQQRAAGAGAWWMTVEDDGGSRFCGSCSGIGS